MRNIYGVFAGSKFALTGNKRLAIKTAKLHNGTVRVKADVPEITAYDAPTFYILSDEIYRKDKAGHANIITA